MAAAEPPTSTPHVSRPFRSPIRSRVSPRPTPQDHRNGRRITRSLPFVLRGACQAAPSQKMIRQADPDATRSLRYAEHLRSHTACVGSRLGSGLRVGGESSTFLFFFFVERRQGETLSTCDSHVHARLARPPAATRSVRTCVCVCVYVWEVGRRTDGAYRDTTLRIIQKKKAVQTGYDRLHRYSDTYLCTVCWAGNKRVQPGARNEETKRTEPTVLFAAVREYPSCRAELSNCRA